MVYVLNQDGSPLMPCNNGKARLLLKKGKVKVVRREPFTVKLITYTKEPVVSDLTMGIDTGFATIGSAVTDSNNRVLYQGEVFIRNDIRYKMDQRRAYRRTRRSRKTRYRKPRFLNRSNSRRKDRFSPTMISKISSHIKEIEFIKSILPVSKIIMETARFDPHLMKNPSLYSAKWGYSKGAAYGYSNTKEYVKARDNYTCKNGKCKSKNTRLEVHHIVYRTNGGSDKADNLITLCKECHKRVHSGVLRLNLKPSTGSLKSATQMNSIRKQLLKLYPGAIETFGYVTKQDKHDLGLLNKEHYNDAIAISCLGRTGIPLTYSTDSIIFKKCVPYWDKQRTMGSRSEKSINTFKIHGFRKFDKVLYRDRSYFIKGRITKGGYAILMDITGIEQKFTVKPLTPKMSNFIKLGSRKSWLIHEQRS